MEVTRYYCELCGKEINYKEWTEIVVAVREYNPTRQNTVSHSKKICIDCMKEVGLVEEPIIDPCGIKRQRNIKNILWDRVKFKNIIKRLVKGE